jgi:hypothetical protein
MQEAASGAGEARGGLFLRGAGAVEWGTRGTRAAAAGRRLAHGGVLVAALHRLVVEHYTADRIPNPYPGGELPWQIYHTVRNAVVRTCRRHGPTGPLGERPLDQAYVQSAKQWELGDEDPVYWIVDDQYNHEMYLYMEFQDARGCTPEWLADVTRTLAEFPGWGIGVASLKKGYVLIFTDRLLVQGPGFRECRDAASVVRAMQKQV